MCTYNGDKYLPEQLESIRCQTRQPFELVVRDDGSTDGTLAMLQEFARRCSYPVRITVNDRNMHFTGNFMKAASECSGDCIVFCDQDDVWASTKLEEIAEAADAQCSDLYIHEGLVIDGRGVATGLKIPDHAKVKATLNVPPFGEGSKGFAMTVDKSVIDEMMEHWDWDYYFAFRTRFGSPLGHDQLIYAWCVSRKIALISKPLVRYRVHESNVTASQTLTGGWWTRLDRKVRSIQFGDFNYDRFAKKWEAERAFLAHMFPNPPRGIRQLDSYLGEISVLWRARADVHDHCATRRQRWAALRRLWQLNRSAVMAGSFGPASLAKDFVLTLFSPRAPR